MFSVCVKYSIQWKVRVELELTFSQFEVALDTVTLLGAFLSG